MTTWRWFVCHLESGPRVFRLATDGSAVERAATPNERANDSAEWISVPRMMDRLVTDPLYPEIDGAEALALIALPSPPSDTPLRGIN